MNFHQIDLVNIEKLNLKKNNKLFFVDKYYKPELPLNLTKYLLLLLVTSMSVATFAQESESVETDTDYIEEVVTATSRETTILEVPYNISTLSGDDIVGRGYS